MREESAEAFLFQRLDEAVTKYGVEARKLKFWTYAIKITILFLAGSSTVLLGWSPVDNPYYTVWSRNMALALGAVSTFIIGISTFWNVENYWLKQKVLFAKVRALKERCFFLKSKGMLSEQAIDDIFNEYRAMMDDRIDYWESLASRKTTHNNRQDDVNTELGIK